MSANPFLDMLAARAEAQENTAAMEMIARMRNPSDTDSPPNTQDLIAQLGQTNPMLGMLAQRLAAQKPVARLAQSEVIEAEIEEIDPAQAQYAIDEAAELRQQLQSMTCELQLLREREELLADALGACSLCWGQDRQCRACRGRGRPGYAAPDEGLFEEFVLPAVQMLRALRNKQGVIVPMMPVTTARQI